MPAKYYILSLLFGAGLGYVLFPVFPDMLLPQTGGERVLIATDPAEQFIVRVVFSICVALVFAAIPFAVWMMGAHATGRRLGFGMLFFGVMLMCLVGAIIYYKNKFLMLLLVDQGDVMLPLSALPYYVIPLSAAAITIGLAVLLRIAMRLK